MEQKFPLWGWGHKTAMSKFAKVCPSLPKSAKVCQSLPKSVKVCHSLPKSAKVCHSLPKPDHDFSEFEEKLGCIKSVTLASILSHWIGYFDGPKKSVLYDEAVKFLSAKSDKVQQMVLCIPLSHPSLKLNCQILMSLPISSILTWYNECTLSLNLIMECTETSGILPSLPTCLNPNEG